MPIVYLREEQDEQHALVYARYVTCSFYECYEMFVI
jgi:hypothetical protein